MAQAGATKTEKARDSGAPPGTAREPGTPGAAGMADTVAGVVLLPVAVVRRVLPDRDLPVLLGAGALAVAGLIEWPVAAAAGLGWAALRRWGPR